MTDHPTARAGVPAIEMTGVAVSALCDSDTTVAEGINWTVNAGDYWVVAGLHGAGKTRLATGRFGLSLETCLKSSGAGPVTSKMSHR